MGSQAAAGIFHIVVLNLPMATELRLQALEKKEMLLIQMVSPSDKGLELPDVPVSQIHVLQKFARPEKMLSVLLFGSAVMISQRVLRVIDVLLLHEKKHQS